MVLVHQNVKRKSTKSVRRGTVLAFHSRSHKVLTLFATALARLSSEPSSNGLQTPARTKFQLTRMAHKRRRSSCEQQAERPERCTQVCVQISVISWLRRGRSLDIPPLSAQDTPPLSYPACVPSCTTSATNCPSLFATFLSSPVTALIRCLITRCGIKCIPPFYSRIAVPRGTFHVHDTRNLPAWGTAAPQRISSALLAVQHLRSNYIRWPLSLGPNAAMSPGHRCQPS
jgi:hypothetical protein